MQWGSRHLPGHSGDPVLTSCAMAALVRCAEGRTITVLAAATSYDQRRPALPAGNAARIMNLAATGSSRLVRYLDHIEGKCLLRQLFSDLIPEQRTDHLAIVAGGALVALWKGRRIGPLVAEELPVVIRARRRLSRVASRSCTDPAGRDRAADHYAPRRAATPASPDGVAAPAPAVVTTRRSAAKLTCCCLPFTRPGTGH